MQLIIRMRRGKRQTHRTGSGRSQGRCNQNTRTFLKNNFKILVLKLWGFGGLTKEEETGLEEQPSPPRGKGVGAYLEVVLDSMEVIREELLTVRQQEGQQKGQGTGDQQKALGQRGLV